jgi:DNA replication and repair protein RecF
VLTTLSARTFRNFPSLDLEIPARGLVIVGDNGHGKTNLLEAIALLGQLRSVRGARDEDMVHFGAPTWHVRATLAPPARATTVALGFERASKRKLVTIDGVEQAKLSSALGAIPSVMFSPTDVALSQTSARYLAALQHYRAALARRNAVLKRAQHAQVTALQLSQLTDEATIWEPALAEHGGTVLAARLAFAQSRRDALSHVTRAIGEVAAVEMRYTAVGFGSLRVPAADAVECATMLAQALELQRPNELKRGVTLVGPHRDDLTLTLGARELRRFGSAGQQRTVAIALRVIELQLMRDANGGAPLLLLDDPFAELDVRRAARVLALLEASGLDQVVMTVPRESDIPRAFTMLDRRRMEHGALTSVLL